MTLFERHDRFLDVRLHAGSAAERLELALAGQRVDRLHLHVEQLLHRLLDLRLGRLQCHLEDHLVFASFAAMSSSTTMPPSFALAESAWRSASARTFFGSSIA